MAFLNTSKPPNIKQYKKYILAGVSRLFGRWEWIVFVSTAFGFIILSTLPHEPVTMDATQSFCALCTQHAPTPTLQTVRSSQVE